MNERKIFNLLCVLAVLALLSCVPGGVSGEGEEYTPSVKVYFGETSVNWLQLDIGHCDPDSPPSVVVWTTRYIDNTGTNLLQEARLLSSDNILLERRFDGEEVSQCVIHLGGLPVPGKYWVRVTR